MTDTRHNLRLQVLPLDLIAYGATDTIRDVGGGLVVRLMQRTEQGAEPVSRKESASIDGADWFDLAAGRTIRMELEDADVREHTAAGVSFRMVAIDGCPFVTSSTAFRWCSTQTRT